MGLSLGFLLSVLSDETSVNVWQDGNIVAFYDGKNAIDKKFNTKIVKSISAGLFKIDIEI